MAKKTDPVEVAERALDRAAEAEANEEKRHAAALELVARLAGEIREMDPDADAEAFAKLVAARDAARGRAEALQERHERAVASTKAAAAQVEEARRGGEAARIAEIDRELRELDAGVRADAQAFLDALHVKIARARRLAGEANLIERQLGRETLSRNRGYALPDLPAGPAAFRYVAAMLPQAAVGVDPLAGLMEVER